MKNKVVWIMVISLLIFTGFMVSMSCLEDNGTFYIEDIEGQREYLNMFPIEGVAGDSTHGITFRLEEGEVTTKFYPVGISQISNLFWAEREGLTGIEQHKYDHDMVRFEKEVPSYIESAPSKDANIQHRDELLEEAFEDFYYNIHEFAGGKTVVTDKVDVYLEIYGKDTSTPKEARVRTGMTFQDKEYYYMRCYEYENNIDTACDYSSFDAYDMGINTFCVKIGDAYYCIVGSNRECQGETALYRFMESGLRENKDWSTEPEETVDRRPFYDEDEYGEAEVLRSFPVDSENRVLAMIAVGDSYLGVFRIEKEKILFELYDLEGNLVAQDLISTELGNQVDGVEAEVFVWDEGDISINFQVYDINREDDNSEVWDNLAEGLYQVDEDGFKRLNYYDERGGDLFLGCRNNLVLDVSTEFENTKLPFIRKEHNYISVINGDTGKVLYRGEFKTDYYEDALKQISNYDIVKNSPYLEDAVGNYYSGREDERMRIIYEVAPINGRGGNLWWR